MPNCVKADAEKRGVSTRQGHCVVSVDFRFSHDRKGVPAGAMKIVAIV
jgi:hypothetical protein